jgi:hypothetical protein
MFVFRLTSQRFDILVIAALLVNRSNFTFQRSSMPQLNFRLVTVATARAFRSATCATSFTKYSTTLPTCQYLFSNHLIFFYSFSTTQRKTPPFTRVNRRKYTSLTKKKRAFSPTHTD